MTPERKIILEHALAPGDVTCTTSMVRDIKLTYGDKYAIDFRTNFGAIYEGNPHLTPLDKSDSDVEYYKLCYQKYINICNKGDRHHFTTAFHRAFTEATGIPLSCLRSQTDLHPTPRERNNTPVSGRYWLIFGGGKTDFPVKIWRFTWYQEIVDRLRSYGLRFAQSGATKPGKPGNIHPPLEHVTNLVGWGYVRHLMWQIYHCEGIICPITCAMHMGSAFNKPVVVIAGGREHWAWEAYTNDGQFGPDAEPIKVPHRYLHTIDQLDCCTGRGCWKDKVVTQGRNSRACVRLAPGPVGAQPVPYCLHMITPDIVCDAVMSYYREEYLPPIGLPQHQVRDWYERHHPSRAPANVLTCPINWDPDWVTQQQQKLTA